MTDPFRIVILGGGTAGWMTACLIAERWLRPGGRPVSITLVESPAIGIVGVGEGSTPQLKALFDRLGLVEADWMSRAAATYKLGIRFDGWSDRPGAERYFHPFPGALDVHTQPQFLRNAAARRRGADVVAHPDRFYLPALLAERKAGPHPREAFPFDLSYGYHFDAHQVGAVLRDEAVRRGVVHRQAQVARVLLTEDGQVDALEITGGGTIPGDLFVDSSGFRAEIAERALGVRHRSYADTLFNDRAVVLATPVDADGPAIATRATALSNGWAWAIPLTHRTGNGYVHASAFQDAGAAETELRRHLGVDDAVEARHLTMRVGRLEESWTANCLAVGLAQGFLEPLEATALHLVQATVEQFIAAFEAGGFTPQHRAPFNARIARRQDGIRDYITAHYRLAQRSDTEYWRANAANDALSDDLKAMMTAWFTGADLEAEIARLDIGGYYGVLSWACLFAGYGTWPADRHLRVPPSGEGAADMDAVDRFLARAAINFAPHRDQLLQD